MFKTPQEFIRFFIDTLMQLESISILISKELIELRQVDTFSDIIRLIESTDYNCNDIKNRLDNIVKIFNNNIPIEYIRREEND